MAIALVKVSVIYRVVVPPKVWWCLVGFGIVVVPQRFVDRICLVAPKQLVISFVPALLSFERYVDAYAKCE